MQRLDLKTVLEVYESASELPEPDQRLLREAAEATERAYAPYSHFCVGAALLFDDGTIVKGSNQENAAYPSGLCAERTAVFWAGANHPDKAIISLAVVARHQDAPEQWSSATPCGACRQALLEYENRQGKPMRVIMLGNDRRIFISPSIANLLPLQFNRQSLEDK